MSDCREVLRTLAFTVGFLAQVTLVLAVGALLFDVPVNGRLADLYLAALLFIAATLTSIRTTTAQPAIRRRNLRMMAHSNSCRNAPVAGSTIEESKRVTSRATR